MERKEVGEGVGVGRKEVGEGGGVGRKEVGEGKKGGGEVYKFHKSIAA